MKANITTTPNETHQAQRLIASEIARQMLGNIPLEQINIVAQAMMEKQQADAHLRNEVRRVVQQVSGL